MSKNVLSNTRCYLIGGMEYEDGSIWRKEIEESLRYTKIKFFNPYKKPFINNSYEGSAERKEFKDMMEQGRYDLVSDSFKKIRADDLRLCDVSDFFVVRVNPSIPSWGSAEELTTINRMKKAVFIFTEGGKKKTPLWIMGMIPHKYIYNNIYEIIDTLKRIDDGSQPIDSDRWKLLSPENR